MIETIVWDCDELVGAEQTVFVHAAERLVDDLRGELGMDLQGDYRLQLGVQAFDELTAEQKIVLIDQVLSYLIAPVKQLPSRTAYLDGTVAAIFAQMLSEVQVEIDDQRMGSDEIDCKVRQEVLDAVMQNADGFDPKELPSADSLDHEEWEWLIERLLDRVLPDEDWKLSNTALDLPPDQAVLIKQSMGISNDYFAEAPPDATFVDARNAWMSMNKRLTGKHIAAWRFGGVPRPRVLVSEVVNAMEIRPKDWGVFLNISTGQVHMIPDLTFDELYSEDLTKSEFEGHEFCEVIKQLQESEFAELSGRFAPDEYQIKSDFCDSVQDEVAYKELRNAIRGGATSQSFQSTLERNRLMNDWHTFRAKALQRAAIIWLESVYVEWTLDDDFYEADF